MKLPPVQVTRAVIQRYARLIERYQSEWGKRPLVLPTAAFFPDEFVGDADSVAILTARMQEHAGLADVPVECRVVFPGAPEATTSSCSSGACGVPLMTGSGLARLVDTGESWVLQVPAPELRHPVALTTNLARSLAYVFLVETQREGEHLEPPIDVTADLVAVGLGFGALMLQGSYIYAKSCGGPQIASVTKVGVAELAIVTALFAEIQGHPVERALKVLDLTQREALSEAHKLFRANKKLVAKLKTDPKAVALEAFELNEPGDLLGSLVRKLSSKPRRPSNLADLDPNMDLSDLESLLINMPSSSQAGRPREKSDKNKAPDELKSLVADALRESRA